MSLLTHLTPTFQYYHYTAFGQFLMVGQLSICPLHRVRIKIKVFEVSQTRVWAMNSQTAQRICLNTELTLGQISASFPHVSKFMSLKVTLNPMINLCPNKCYAIKLENIHCLNPLCQPLFSNSPLSPPLQLSTNSLTCFLLFTYL